MFIKILAVLLFLLLFIPLITFLYFLMMIVAEAELKRREEYLNHIKETEGVERYLEAKKDLEEQDRLKQAIWHSTYYNRYYW